MHKRRKEKNDYNTEKMVKNKKHVAIKKVLKRNPRKKKCSP